MSNNKKGPLDEKADSQTGTEYVLMSLEQPTCHRVRKRCVKGQRGGATFRTHKST